MLSTQASWGAAGAGCGMLLRPQHAARRCRHVCQRRGEQQSSWRCASGSSSGSSGSSSGSSGSSSGSSSSGGSAPPSASPSQYLSPFSEVDASAGAAAAAAAGSSPDPWEQTLSVHATLYLPKTELPQHQQIDFAARRAQRTLAEIQAAGAKLGLPPERVESALQQLVVLVPGLAPNTDLMRASDWACVARDVERVASLVIALRSSFPRLDIGAVLARTPKLLLKSTEQVQEDAQQVKAMLAGLEDPDAVIQAVPSLLSPLELHRALSNLAAWFPSQAALAVLATNPTLLLNIEEADLDADPTYGEITTAG